MDTAQELKEILKQTRSEDVGITLELVGRIMREVFDEAELRALLIELNLK